MSTPTAILVPMTAPSQVPARHRSRVSRRMGAKGQAMPLVLLLLALCGLMAVAAARYGAVVVARANAGAAADAAALAGAGRPGGPGVARQVAEANRARLVEYTRTGPMVVVTVEAGGQRATAHAVGTAQ